MKKSNGLFLLILIVGMTSLNAQEIWQVDARVTIKAEQKDHQTFLTIKGAVDNDDAARSPKVIVSLPRNAKVKNVKLSKNIRGSKYRIVGNKRLKLPHKPTRIDSYVEFDLRDLNKEDFKIQVSIVAVNDGFRPNSMASAFIYTLTPELNKQNNYDDCKVN